MPRFWKIVVRIIVAFGIAWLGLAWAATDPAGPQDTRQRFLEAYKAGLKGDTARAKSLARDLGGYVLYPYLKYALLKGRLDSAGNQEVLSILKRYQGYAFAPRLKRDWLEHLAEKKDWATFLKHYDGGGSSALQCHGLNARLQTGHTWTLAADALDLWLVGYSQAAACDPVFEWLYGQGRVNGELRFGRVALSLEAGNTGLAAYLARPLSAEYRQWYERWRDMIAQPVATLKEAGNWLDTEIARRIVRDGLYRVANTKEQGGHAWRLWQTARATFEFSDRERGRISRRLALDAATDYHPDSIKMLGVVPGPYINDSVRAWRVRTPLMRRDWKQVLAAIDAMPAHQRREKAWRYWYARALEAAGKQAAAERTYRELAQDVSYYGFLAADRIEAPYVIKSQTPVEKPKLQRALIAKPAMQRAFELFHVGLTLSARTEWRRALRGATREELIQAALLAYEQDWYDRVIFALADAALWNAYEMRYPLAFKKKIQTRAAKYGLASTWLYGLIRSESLFMTDAHSSANAYGLMQLLPATGRSQAREMGMNWRGAEALMEPEYSLALGSAYLAGLANRYRGNTVLATAAYNGGPEEVDAWVRQNPPEYAAIWIETIPFYETRNYLKRVLACSVIYDWRLGDSAVQLSARLPGKH